MKYLIFVLLFLLPHSLFAASGASLSVLPSTGSYQVGDVFTVSILVATAGQPINAVEGKITFNTDEIEVAGISKDSSIVGSWTTEPAVDSEEGSIAFGGGITEGFTGDSGKVFSIDFRPRRVAESTVRFSTGAAILANDGFGTNLIESMNAGAYVFTAKEVIPVIVQSGVSEPEPLVLGASTSTPFSATTSTEAISLVSSSHPDQNKWYSESTAGFSWTLPPGVNAVRLSVNAKPDAAPTKLYSPAIAERVVKDTSDGISYFHLRARTENGWGESVHYRFQTDTEQPEKFQIAQASTTGMFGFIFTAEDRTSGIEKYLVQIDGGPETEWKDDGSRAYIPEVQSSGDHILSVKALDMAGNFATSSIAFTLDPVPAPTITDFPKTLSPGNILYLRGVAMPHAAVFVRVSKDGEREREHFVTAAPDGSFTFIMEGKAEDGVYSIYTEQVFGGTRSSSSENIVIPVNQPEIILFGKIAVRYLSVLIPLVTLILLLIFVLAFGWHRWKIFRMDIQKELEKAEAVSRKSFSDLKKEINEDERIFEEDASEGKTKKEAVKRLKKSIDAAEEEVEKDLAVVKQKVKRTVKAKRVG
ncbi:MAG: hypothetical protein HYT94_01940 [Parcubacteria group bacterium]|nr:hypothetical protein [Parcubacteria group bacterium]